jgi:sugar phosphate isomerase/epimerase
MNRRDFTKAALTTAAVGWGGSLAAESAGDAFDAPFRLNYAPNFRQFRAHAGEDPVAVLRYMHARGFRALEDNGMMERPVEEQARIGAELNRLGMTMGVFVAYADFRNPTFASHGTFDENGRLRRDKGAVRALLEARFTEAVEVARRVNAKWCTVVPGTWDPGLEEGYQTVNVVENLQFCASICERAGLVMVLEPLNPMNHPGLFLTRIPQAYALCKAVGSPACKILDDLYHQQITEGNLIPNLDRAWDEIAYLQVGDNPGRKEPTTGEIHYRNVFRHLHAKGYAGIVGMEHGLSLPGKEGEARLIEAYREVDNFET